VMPCRKSFGVKRHRLGHWGRFTAGMWGKDNNKKVDALGERVKLVKDRYHITNPVWRDQGLPYNMCAKLPAKRQVAVAIDGLYSVEIKKMIGRGEAY
jgi:hypothetical protein